MKFFFINDVIQETKRKRQERKMVEDITQNICILEITVELNKFINNKKSM